MVTALVAWRERVALRPGTSPSLPEGEQRRPAPSSDAITTLPDLADTVSRVRALDWRWRNVPVPEPHLGGLLVGAVLHLLRPWPLGADGLVRLGLGGTIGLAGLVVVVWSVQTVGREDVEAPSSLVTAGPYRYSRNPMYVGWTGLYVGASLLVDAAWPLVLLPAVALAVHLVVRREERTLEGRFGEEYRRYRREVRRYL